jgi:hypothetical protein
MTDHLLRPAYAQRGNHLEDAQALGLGLWFELSFRHGHVLRISPA